MDQLTDSVNQLKQRKRKHFTPSQSTSPPLPPPPPPLSNFKAQNKRQQDDFQLPTQPSLWRTDKQRRINVKRKDMQQKKETTYENVTRHNSFLSA